MKDISFFLLKNYLSAKMRRGFRSSCNSHGSTSTLDQGHSVKAEQHLTSPSANENTSPRTLEDMIVQLEIEEEIARRAKLDECYDDDHNAVHHRVAGRMSCVNSSDILRSARNALNQYPRFSLDGKDAMYRSSFRIGSDQFDGRKPLSEPNNNKFTKPTRSESHGAVVWCEPGVVAKLMGLDSIPVPAKGRVTKRTSVRRRSEMNGRDGFRSSGGVEMNGCDGFRRGMRVGPSMSRGGYRVMNSPAHGEQPPRGVGGWPTLRLNDNGLYY